MQPQYYVVRADGNKEGPYDENVIRQMVASGQIPAGDKLEDAKSGSIWEPSVFAPAPMMGPATTSPRKVNPIVWVLVGLCVLCIPCIAVFAAILFPVFGTAKLAAQMTQTMSYLKQTGNAVLSYQADFDDKFPPKMDKLSNTWPYIQGYAKMPLPESKNPGNPEFNGNAKLGGTLATKITSPPRTFEFFDSAPWSNDKRIVLYADTHVKKLSETQFQQGLMNGMVEK